MNSTLQVNRLDVQQATTNGQGQQVAQDYLGPSWSIRFSSRAISAFALKLFCT